MSIIIKDFKDIVDAVVEELKVQPDDTVTLNRIKRIVNSIYIQEVVPYQNWKWLYGHTRVLHKARYNSGSASVTPDSATVTLDTAPDVSLGSFEGYFFAADGFSDIYVISSHTAGSTTVTLASTYQGNLSTEATFKIWKDYLNLPTDCKETTEVWHNYYVKPMEGMGLRKFRDIQLLNPRLEGPPYAYYTGDYTDPSTGDGETESDRYRTLKVYPAVYDKNVTINIDYIKEASALTADGDEPIMPVEDRVVLVYGTLARAWVSIARNESAAQFAKADYQNKLARMAGKVEDSSEGPQIKPSSTYVKSRRAPRFSIASAQLAGGGSSGYTPISYLENVTINGGTVTGNITVNSGITIDGVDISVLSSDFSAHLADTTDAHDASAISFVAAGDLAADDVQEALEELDTEKMTKSASATDNALVRFDGTTGKAVQNSGVIVDDSNNMSLPGNLVHGTSGATYVPMVNTTLTDNTSSPAALISIATATYTAWEISYSMTRGTGNFEAGTIWVATDGTNADGAGGGITYGTLGVTFSYDISGSNMRMLYTTTSTGTNVTMKYTLKGWIM